MTVRGQQLGGGGGGLAEAGREARREKFEGALGARPGGAAGKGAGVVFDAGAEADFAQHLHVVGGAHADALGFEEAAGGLEFADAVLHLGEDAVDGGGDLLGRHDEVLGGGDHRVGEVGEDASGEGVEAVDRFDFVAEEDDADAFGGVGGEDVEGVAARAEGARLGGDVVARVLDGDEPLHHGVAFGGVAGAQGDDHAAVVLGGAEAVDAGDGGDDDDVGPVDERVGGGEAEAVDFVVGGGVLLDVGVGLGDVGLGLVVVVVADEVLDGVVREELLELGVELGGEGLVVADDQRGAAEARDDVRHREGLAAAGDAFEGAVALAGGEGGAHGVDRLRLVAGRREGGYELKGGVHAGEGV